MFTGIIETIGTVEKASDQNGGRAFRIRSVEAARELHISDSISLNGACHTVVWRDDASFEVLAVEETLKKTALGDLRGGSPLNLELPMRLNGRLGGHLVLGHVDTVGIVLVIEQRLSSTMFTIQVDPQFAKYLIPVGSIAVDGVSLTIAAMTANRFLVSIIPHTLERTIFSTYVVGTRVNLEFDIVGKYIERLMRGDVDNPSSGTFPSEADLREQGF